MTIFCVSGAALGDTELVLGFVRGEVDVIDLRPMGVAVSRVDSELRIDEEAVGHPVEVTCADIATGLLTHWALGTTLQHWAILVLGLDAIDMTHADTNPSST